MQQGERKQQSMHIHHSLLASCKCSVGVCHTLLFLYFHTFDDFTGTLVVPFGTVIEPLEGGTLVEEVYPLVLQSWSCFLFPLSILHIKNMVRQLPAPPAMLFLSIVMPLCLSISPET